MRTRTVGAAGAIALFLAAALNLATATPAEAFIHEIIAAICRAPAGDVEPPGQSLPSSKAFIKALMATGFISSIDDDGVNPVVIHFDPTVPNSKFRSTGSDFLIPGGNVDGRDLILSPLVVVDPSFPAHAHCKNFG
jgi:hypothetical protein